LSADELLLIAQATELEVVGAEKVRIWSNHVLRMRASDEQQATLDVPLRVMRLKTEQHVGGRQGDLEN
jgi:hypothetical protein